MANKTEMKAEAIKRMKEMGMFKDAIKIFEKEDKILVSEAGGILWDIDGGSYSGIPEKVKDIENEYGCLAYHVVKTPSSIGTMYSIFYVSKYEDEWEMDNEDIKDNMAVVYVYNEDAEDCSEFGSIVFKPMNGGIVRIG